jgi:hypothetical protein
MPRGRALVDAADAPFDERARFGRRTTCIAQIDEVVQVIATRDQALELIKDHTDTERRLNGHLV